MPVKHGKHQNLMKDTPPTSILFRPPAACTPTPGEVAQWIDGELVEGRDSPEHLIGFATLDQATAEEISFVAEAKGKKQAEASTAGLLITPLGLDLGERPRVEVDSVWHALPVILGHLYPAPKPESGVHPSAFVDPSAQIDPTASIGANCSIGGRAIIGARAILGANCSVDPDCRIGEDSRVHNNVALQGLVHVGARCVLHSGVVLGADGFKFQPTATGVVKVPQVGVVILEDDVEIGANSCVDRAFVHETRIGAGTKIDNLVQVGHNCRIGKGCLIAGQSGFAGSAVVEDYCMLGGGVGVAPGVTVGARSMVGGGTGVHKDVAPGSTIMGYPYYMQAREFRRVMAHFRKLPDIVARLRKLEKLAAQSEK